MSSDIKLYQDTKGVWTFDFIDGDFELTQGLDTAIYQSVLCEVRALESQVSTPLQRMGHFRNEFSAVDGYEIGSKQWIYTNRGKNTAQTRANLKTELNNGLRWIVQDGFAKAISIEVVQVSSVQVNISIILDANQESQKKYTMFINTFINAN